MSSGVSALAVCSARICSSYLLLLRVSCSKPPWVLLFLFFALFMLSLPMLAYCASVVCAIFVVSLWYICAIYAILRSGWRLLCAISVLYLCSLCYIYIYMRPCAGDCSVHKLGLSNCIAVWPLRMHRQKPKTHVLLERRARQAPKQVFLLILHAHAAPQKRSRKLKFHFSKPKFGFPPNLVQNHTVLTRFYLFLIIFACVCV